MTAECRHWFQNKKISLIIPCFNEERGIQEILEKKPLFINEVIVVDNNSTDKTSEIAKKLGAKVIFEKHRGYGQAYLAGFKVADGDIFVTMDGDNSYPVREISKLVDFLLDERADFVSGCRFPLQEKQSMRFLNRFGNFMLTLVFFIVTFGKIRDSQSGMWVFRREILDKIKLVSDGMAFSEEIKMEVMFNKDIVFAEVPISYSVRLGQVKLNIFKDGFANLFFLFKKGFDLISR